MGKTGEPITRGRGLVVGDGGELELPTKLSDVKFHQLADVPAELEWFANLDNPRTRRAYKADMRDFMKFVGIRAPKEFRLITRGHVLAWRQALE